MNLHVFICATALCIVQISSPANASGIYKWIDHRGVVHYADRPSQVHPSNDLGDGELPYLHIQQPLEYVKRQKSTARSTVKKSRKTRSRVDCKHLREQIRNIEANLRQGYREPAGSRMRARKRQWSEQLYKHCY